MNERNDSGFGRRFAARVLTVIGALLLVVTIMSGYLRWQAFDDKTFKTTAGQLIADDAIRQRVAARTTDVFLENVDLTQEIAARLPENQKRLAPILAATISTNAERFTYALLSRPKVQDLWVDAATVTHDQVVKVLEGDTKLVKTVDGKLVLDLGPIVVELGDRVAVIGRAARAIPPDKTVIAIMPASTLEKAQRWTQLFQSIAPWIWVLPLLCFIAAVWLARGRRREELRAVSIGFVAAGVLVLFARALLGRYVVNDVVPRPEGKQAAEDAWSIITQLLADGAWSAILIGVVFLFGVVVAGPSRLGRFLREALHPVIESRWLLYGVIAAFLVLLAWWNPIAQTGRWSYMLIFAGLLVAGAEMLRRAVLGSEAADEGSQAPPPPPASPPPAQPAS